MDTSQLVVILSCLAAVVLGLLLGYGSARLVVRSRLRAVTLQADDIIHQAREDADKVKKEAELKARDDLYQQREALNRETEQVGEELREDQRRLDNRGRSLEEKE